MTKENNLLFVALALKIGHIDQSQYAQACSDWSADTSSPIAERLIQRGWLTQGEQGDVEKLCEEYILQHGGSVRAALSSADSSESISTDEPSEINDPSASEDVFMKTIDQPANAESVIDENVDSFAATIDSPLPSGIDEPSNPHEHTVLSNVINPGDHHEHLETVEYRPDTLSRYTLTRVHGKGGLGQVWLAQDTNLKRDVALKEILPGKETDKLTVHRLIKEAQITGQLEHPNIIPVYELGENPESNAPFYTMRFLRGETLSEKIADYHKHRKDGTATRLELRNLLGCFVNVCHAMAYAHSRGIIHRDLKPGNIMLGSFGEVLVLDWGLATIVDEQEEDVDLKSIEISWSFDVMATQDGAILGSPAYMAPEQANGKRSLMDGRTDIYGLGSILFCILAGQPPHKGEATGNTVKDTLSLLSRIGDGPTPSVRDVAPWVPPALDAICFKAMGRKRGDRFQTGTELAEEVSRWLADEPLACYAGSLSDRMFRWLRRNRSWAQAISAALILVAVTATVASVLINSARKEQAIARADADTAYEAEKVARAEEELAKQEAIRRFRDARTAVDKSLTGISDVLTNFPGVEPIRIELLKEAASDYERFASEKSDDPDLLAESGVAWYRLAEVRRMLNQAVEAEEAYRKSIGILTALVEKHPSNVEFGVHLATSRNLLATWLTLLDGRIEEAQSIFAKAEDGLEQFIGNDTIHVEVHEALAALLLNRAILQSQIRDHDTAAHSLEKARSVLEALIKDDPSEDHRRLLARTWWRIGRLNYQISQYAEAIEAQRKAADQFTSLGRVNPSEPRNLEGLADAENDLANALSETGKDLEAITRFRRAVDGFQLLLEARPGVPAYLEKVAVVQTNIVGLYLRNGHSRDAYEDCIAALQVLESLTTKHDEISRFHEQRATCSMILAMIARDLNDDEFAIRALNAAAEEFALLVESIPDVVAYRRRLSVTFTTQGRTLHKAGRLQEAADQFDQALTGLTGILGEDDQDHLTRAALAWCCLQFGTLKHQQGETAQATDLFLKAVQERERLIADTPTAEQLHDFAYLLAYCPDNAFQDYEKAIELCDNAISVAVGNAKYASLKALALLRNEQPKECVESAERAVARRGMFPHASDHFILAMAHWKLEDTEAARESYAQAIKLMDDQQPGNIELAELRAEAEALLNPEQPEESAESKSQK